MTKISASVAMFAEDIREEVQGTMSLIGIFPDNINYDKPEGQGQHPQLPKLVVYVRTIISHSEPITDGLEIQFRSPSGLTLASNPVPAEFILEKQKETEANGSPQTTLISQIRMNPFPLIEDGRFEIMTICGTESTLAGFINVVGNVT